MKYIRITALLAASLLISGCASRDVVQAPIVSIVDNATPSAEGTRAAATSSLTETAADTSVTTEPTHTDEITQSAESAETAEPSRQSESTTATADFDKEPTELPTEAVSTEELSDEELQFINSSILVGDSICRGYSAYDILPNSRVYARGNLGARTFFDYTFYYGNTYEEVTFDEVLSLTEPKYIFLSMGMNDINMTDEQQFCENYKAIIDAALAGSKAEVFVCGITPICSDFATPEHITGYNNALSQFIEENYSQRVHYLYFGQHLINDDGTLRQELHSGDGIHLAPAAYNVGLRVMGEAAASLS